MAVVLVVRVLMDLLLVVVLILHLGILVAALVVADRFGFHTRVGLAATGAATDETSIATDSVTAMAASAANVTLCVFMSKHQLLLPIKEL